MKTRVLTLGLMALASSAAFADWDLQADFSTTTNPNGAWNYGRYDNGGNFITNTDQGLYFGFAQGWGGPGGFGRPLVGMDINSGEVVLHADFSSEPAPYAGVHWVAPAAGDYHVSGSFLAGDVGAVSEFVSYDRAAYIMQVFDETDDRTFSFDQHLEAGGFFDFFVGAPSSGDPSFGTTPLRVHISPVPEPASLSLLGLGFLGVIRRRRK